MNHFNFDVTSVQQSEKDSKTRKKPLRKSNLRMTPYNHLYKGCIFGNIFLVGDAAGLTSKVWGEGIFHALTSGKEIGKKILNSNYRMVELNKTIRVKKRQERLSALFDLFPNLQKSFMKLFIMLMKGSWFQYYFGIASPK